MLEYQEETTGDALKPKSLILPNPVPDSMLLAPPPDDRFVFTFLGSFLGSRRPDSLLSAFARLTKRYPDVELHIYGNWPNSLSQRVANDPDLFGRVLLKGWTHDVGFVLSNSSCLVDIDADSVHSVYTSNKLMEYISTDRPVLLISPPGSASRDLVKSLKQTCLVVDHDTDQICQTMEHIISHKIQKYKFTERKKLVADLSTSKISCKLEDRIEKLLNNSEVSLSL
jgi:glycosyltransferase involved in cell wall biosynthesis